MAALSYKGCYNGPVSVCGRLSRADHYIDGGSASKETRFDLLFGGADPALNADPDSYAKKQAHELIGCCGR